MAQLVETSEEDAYLAVASYLGDLIDEDQEERTKLIESAGSRFVDECKQLYFGEQFRELIDKFADKFELVLSKSTSDQDVDCCLSVTCHLVSRLAPQQALAAAQRLSAALTSNTESRPDKRLQSLVTLYNILAEPPAKLAMLLQLLSYAKAAALADTLLPVVKAHSDAWAKDLGLPPAEERALYIAAADALRTCTRKPKTAAKEANRLLCKCLMTYEGERAADLPAAAPVAVQVVSDFLKSGEVFQFDLGDNPAVQALAGDPKSAPLHRMLTIYLTGSVAEYESFVKSNGAVLSGLGISPEDGLTKMRLLALMGLAHGVPEITFEAIQSSLGLGLSEVEPLVVQALGKRLMEARIDQLRGVVTISKCSSRTFGGSQWRELQAQLAGWGAAVAHVREVGREERAVLAKSVAELGLVSA